MYFHTIFCYGLLVLLGIHLLHGSAGTAICVCIGLMSLVEKGASIQAFSTGFFTNRY
jgi:hypothetical protein